MGEWTQQQLLVIELRELNVPGAPRLKNSELEVLLSSDQAVLRRLAYEALKRRGVQIVTTSER